MAKICVGLGYISVLSARITLGNQRYHVWCFHRSASHSRSSSQLTSFQLGCVEVIATDQARVAIGPPDLEPDDLPGKRIDSAMQNEPELVFPLVMLVDTPHVPNACTPKSGPFNNSLASLLHKVPFIQIEVHFEHFSVERFAILPILPSIHLPRNRETIVMKYILYNLPLENTGVSLS